MNTKEMIASARRGEGDCRTDTIHRGQGGDGACPTRRWSFRTTEPWWFMGKKDIITDISRPEGGQSS